MDDEPDDDEAELADAEAPDAAAAVAVGARALPVVVEIPGWRAGRSRTG